MTPRGSGASDSLNRLTATLDGLRGRLRQWRAPAPESVAAPAAAEWSEDLPPERVQPVTPVTTSADPLTVEPSLGPPLPVVLTQVGLGWHDPDVGREELEAFVARREDEASADEDEALVYAPDEEEEGVRDAPLQDMEPELLQIVVEEVQELVASIEAGLAAWTAGQSTDQDDLHRQIHTLKGTVAIAGAMKTRRVIHHMETLMEEMELRRAAPSRAQIEALNQLFAKAKAAVQPWWQAPVTATSEADSDDSLVRTPSPVVLKNVRVSADVLDRLINEVNEARLSRGAIEELTNGLKARLRSLDTSAQHLGRLSRQLELDAEGQIEFRRNELEVSGEEFDPLELDRYTRLQELARFFGEAVADVQDVERDMRRSVSEQQTLLAYQSRSIQDLQDSLHKTRLTPVDDYNERLYKVVLLAGHDTGKSVRFGLVGGRVELDRTLLDKLMGPLEHVLRNAVAHGIESPDARLRAGKPVEGAIQVRVRQAAGRVWVAVDDDGGGLNVTRIRDKAIEKGWWEASAPMDDRQAAQMICRPGFSTAEQISETAGRGVGMDVVRNDVLAMGGRFELLSRPGFGLSVAIQVPTTIATASVLSVHAGEHTWAIPVELIEEVALVDREVLRQAQRSGQLAVAHDETIPYQSLSGLMGAEGSEEASTVLLLREGDRRCAVGVHRLGQVLDAPLRTLSRVWASQAGLMGAVLLPNGHAAFLVDPLRLSWEAPAQAPVPTQRKRQALIMVVDDSVTMRKAIARCVERDGFRVVQAKDGQEALELLVDHAPELILMDVEMPRMDGFACAKSIRESAQHSQVPIVMISSRDAAKHRQRAQALGVNDYLGKPFQDEDLLALVHRYLGTPTPALRVAGSLDR